MNLTEVYRIALPRKKRKRVGRGHGSGHGKTCGRGHKGQKSRSGHKMNRWFEGGQMPFIRRIPKRGFHNKWRQEFIEVNVGLLEKHFTDGETVTLEELKKRKVVKVSRSHPLPLKILGEGELTKKLIVEAHKFSASAEKKILDQGGEVKKLPLPKELRREKLKKAKAEFLKRKRQEK